MKERRDHRPARMLALYRGLIALRRARAEPTDPWFGSISVDFDDDQRSLMVDRSGLQIAVLAPATA